MPVRVRVSPSAPSQNEPAQGPGDPMALTPAQSSLAIHIDPPKPQYGIL